MDDPDDEPELPFDERFRYAEQFSMDFTEAEEPQPHVEMQVCIGNCNICRFCDNETNN